MIGLAFLLVLSSTQPDGDYGRPPELVLNPIERCWDNLPAAAYDATSPDTPEAYAARHRAALLACAAARREAILATAERLRASRPNIPQTELLGSARQMVEEWEADHLADGLRVRFGEPVGGNPIIPVNEPSIHGADLPDQFRDRNVGAYTRCLRAWRNDANEPIQIDPAAPTVVQFGQLVTYCGAERLRAASSLRGYIQTRHPDWSPEQLAEGAEFVLTGIDLEHIVDARRPISDGVHAPLRERF